MRLSERYWDPLPSSSSPQSRAVINRIAFQALCQSVNIYDSLDKRSSFINAWENIKIIEFDITSSNMLPDSDLREASALSERMLRNLFQHQPSIVSLNPLFAGCGLINSCYGDAISGSGRIIELKDGERPFRSYEFRQLLIYAALHLNSTGCMANELQVINSRRGLSITVNLLDFSNEVAGQSPFDLLHEIIRTITDASIPR